MIEEIIEIENEAFHDPWSRETFIKIFQENNYHILHIKDNDNFVGYIIVLEMIEVLEIVRFAVKKDFRKKGYGKLLIEMAINKAKELEYKKILLEVRASNKIAIDLYEELGFQELSIRKNYYKDNNEDAIILVREQ